MTALGAAAILYLISCARQSELELRVLQAQIRVEKLKAERQSLVTELAALRDPALLRQVAQAHNLVPARSAGIDEIDLEEKLPPRARLACPLVEGPGQDATWARAPATRLVQLRP
jgi:hypothetical protein